MSYNYKTNYHNKNGNGNGNGGGEELYIAKFSDSTADLKVSLMRQNGDKPRNYARVMLFKADGGPGKSGSSSGFGFQLDMQEIKDFINDLMMAKDSALSGKPSFMVPREPGQSNDGFTKCLEVAWLKNKTNDNSGIRITAQSNNTDVIVKYLRSDWVNILVNELNMIYISGILNLNNKIFNKFYNTDKNINDKINYNAENGMRDSDGILRDWQGNEVEKLTLGTF